MQLYLEFDQPVAEDALERLRALLKRRGNREPLQHLLGTVEFFGKEYKTDSRALIPRPETEELVDYVVKKFKENPPQRILDLCCGSGVIGLSLKSAFGEATEVTLSDLSPEALSLAQENAEALSLNVSLIRSDLFSEIEGEFDLIISNPPYVAEGYKEKVEPEVDYDPALALYSGEDGLDLIRSLIPAAHEHLSAEGELWMEIGYDQHKEVEELLNTSHFKGVETLTDMDGIARFPKGGK